MDKSSTLMISRFFKGLDQFEKGDETEAWKTWEYCMYEIENCKYAAEVVIRTTSISLFQVL